MRQAAKEAAIITETSASSLLLCLEPEGASIQCREDSETALKETMVKESTVMVLDCGGGTVDITVHLLKCNPDERFVCEELLPSSGWCEWGSKFVDFAFETFLSELFGEEFYQIYKKNAMARLDILKHFEMLKRKYDYTGASRSRLQLSYLGEELSAAKLGEFVKTYNENQVKANEEAGGDKPPIELKQRGSSQIDLPSELMASFFKPLFNQITSKVSQLLNDAALKGSPVNFIFMVGGFSESPFLKTEIKAIFEKENVIVLVPRRPQVSVIRGACMFGLNPRSITSRISKMTYGINTLTTFDPVKHPEEKKVVIEGEDFCEDVFDAFVKQNEAVSIDEVHVKTYCPVRARQTVMRIIFYASEDPNALFVDDAAVKPLGELSIDIGRPF